MVHNTAGKGHSYVMMCVCVVERELRPISLMHRCIDFSTLFIYRIAV